MLLFFPVTVIATHIEIYATIFIYGLLVRCMKVKIIVDGRKIFMFMAPLRYHREEWEAGTERKVSVFCIILNEEEKQRKKINSQFISRDYKHSFFNKTCTVIFVYILPMCVCVFWWFFSIILCKQKTCYNGNFWSALFNRIWGLPEDLHGIFSFFFVWQFLYFWEYFNADNFLMISSWFGCIQ